MSKPILDDTLMRMLQGFENRISSLERSQNVTNDSFPRFEIKRTSATGNTSIPSVPYSIPSMQIDITPEFDCLFICYFQLLVRTTTASWNRLVPSIVLDKVDADGYTTYSTDIMHNSASSDYNIGNILASYKLVGGTSYSAYGQVTGSTGGTWEYYGSPPDSYMTSFVMPR